VHVSGQGFCDDGMPLFFTTNVYEVVMEPSVVVGKWIRMF
jgi:hypothetical protein